MLVSVPKPGDTTVYAGASLGYAVRASNGTTYFMTASHLPNIARGVNGATGDSVFQPQRLISIPGGYGRIALNHPWETNPSICGTDQRPGKVGNPVHYCTDIDVALATYTSGSGGALFRVGTSVTEGHNGAWGSDAVNNWYPIYGTLEPEYAPAIHNVVHKSGAKTGTTTGAIVLPYTSYYSDVNWPIVKPPAVQPTVTVWFTGAVRVIHAGWGEGDSGGPVFMRDEAGGTAYFALGIQIAGEGHKNSQGRCDAGVGCSFYFTPWGAIEARYNLTLDPRTFP